MSTLPSLSLSAHIPYLWGPAELAVDRQGITYTESDPYRVQQKRRKLVVALQNRGMGLQRFADRVSDDEAELENQAGEIRNFGYSWMVPTGRHTSQEDEADAFLDPAEHDEPSPGPRPTMTHPLIGAAARPRDNAPAAGAAPPEEAAGSDLDAEVEDMDAAQDGSVTADSSQDQENQGETTEED